MDVVLVLNVAILNVARGNYYEETRLKVVKGEYNVELHAEIAGKEVLISIDPAHIDYLCLILQHVRAQLVPTWSPELTLFGEKI